MKTYDNGSGFTVSYSEDDAERFSDSWPCSTVEELGSFTFENNGDLVGLTGTAERNDGDDWLAFSRDCQRYGETRIRALRRKHARAIERLTL